MKFSKRILSVIICITLICVSVPTYLFVFANDNEDYIVWEANADNVLTDTNQKLNAFDSAENMPSVVKGYDVGGGFYRYEFSLKDNGSNSALVSAKTDISSSLSGFGWLANKNVLNKLKPYLKISFQYRLATDKELPNDAKICIFATSENTKEISRLITVPVSASESWNTVELQNIENTFSSTWNEGYFSIGLYSETSNFDGYQILDIKGLKLVVNSANREDINSALDSIRNVTSIANFTRGVSLGKYKGVKDYFSLFKNYDKKSIYGTTVQENSFTISILGCENACLSVSQTRAKGTIGDVNGDTVVIETKILNGYKISDVVISKSNGDRIDWKQIKKNEQYSFVMPDSAVTVEIITKALDYTNVNLLWQMTADQYQDTPWYYGYEWPVEWSTVPLEDTSAYRFKVKENSATVTLYGRENSTESREDYFDTAVVSFMVKTDTEEDRKLTICTEDTDVSKLITVNKEWQTITMPLKEVAAEPNFGHFAVTFHDFEIDESFFFGPIYIWSFDTGKTDQENYNTLMNIDGYEESLTNELLGIIGYSGLGDTPWCEAGGDYLNWDSAWYMKFRDETPWLVTPNVDAEVSPYQFVLQDAEISGEVNRIDISGYIDTGYLEFYIYTSSEKCVLPFTIQSFGEEGRLYIPFTVTYDVAKAREDGFMCFRIPFTYFRDFGLDLENIGVIALTGNQPIPNELIMSPFKFYTNYAEIDDPVEVPKDEPIEERDIPIELDSTIINAVLDKDYGELLVPENTYLWEILSAITLDSKDVTVDFVEGNEILIDENEVITEGMKMRLYRRGIKLTEFDIYYQIEE